MKKIFFTIFILFLFVFNSCTGDDTQSDLSRMRIEKVLAEENYETQKMMYAMLDSNEKYKIWDDKINAMIKNDDLNSGQVELIKDLKRHLSANLFDETVKNDEREIFKYVYVKEFLKISEKLFDRKYIYVNLFSISNKALSPELSQPNCTCNRGSMWSCAMATSDCGSSSSCDSSTSGCGFGGFFECNGKCFS